MARKCIKLFWLIGALMMSQVACGSTNGNGNGINGASTTNMGASTSPAVISLGSTSTSILSTYLASLPANEQLSPLTTILLQQQQLQQSTTSMSGEKLTTSGPSIPVVDFSQTPMQMQTQAPLVTFSDTTSTFGTSVLTETVNIEPQPEHPTIITNEHELLGCGPNNREGIGIQKALDWLREKRSPDYSWENDTNMVILAKELSNGKESNSPDEQTISDLENMLSIKQMEIEIMTILDQHRSIPKPQPNSDRLARYILSLGSLCKDSRRFYGHDLVAALQHHEPIQDQEFALATLAACSAATHVRKRQIRRLLDIASGEVSNVDTMAMVLLALRCIVTDHRHRHLTHFIRRPARGLASLQGPRGSFGSLRSTALAMQALQDLDPDPAGSWNRSAASKWILDRQQLDGGWAEEPLQDGQDPNIGIGLTADILLALGCKGLGAVRALQCDHVMREPNGEYENGDAKLAYPVPLPDENTEQKNLSYTYTLWLESNITENYSLTLISLKNTSFFKAMTQAADQDSRFAFEAREWPNGHYVHTLAGKKEEPSLYHYWLLYRLPEFPDPYNPPGNQLIAPVGVDELLVEDGEHYLYWYKKL